MLVTEKIGPIWLVSAQGEKIAALGGTPPVYWQGQTDDRSKWTFYTFAGWQGIGEDLQSVVQNPGFANPAYPADDFSLPKGVARCGIRGV